MVPIQSQAGVPLDTNSTEPTSQLSDSAAEKKRVRAKKPKPLEALDTSPVHLQLMCSIQQPSPILFDVGIKRSKLLTGNRIRRVKCDEQKPACLRCTSTKRVCDGYDGVPHSRKKHGVKYEYLDTDAQGSLAVDGRVKLRVLRPLVADIEGTQQERMFFHRFRRVAETGLALHVSNLGSFWKRLVPQMGHSDPAVRHALIALGSSWQTMKLRARPNNQLLDPKHMLIDSCCTQQLELVTFQQYNKAIYHLRRHVAAPWSPRSVEMTLICCIIFICLETTQGNQAAVAAHIANGLQIIKTLPQELVHYTQAVGDEAVKYDAKTNKHGYNSDRVSRSEWRQLLDFFTQLEFGSLTYGLSKSLADPQPSLSLRIQSCSAPFDDMHPPGGGITSLDEANRIQVHLMLQTYTQILETAPYKGDAVWWSNPVQKRRHQHLLSQVRRVLRLLNEFAAGPHGPGWGDKAESCSIIVDLIHTHGVLIAAECIPHDYTRREVGERFAGAVLAIVELSERFVRLFGHPDGVPDVMLDTGPMISLHVALSVALDPAVRRRGVEVLRFLSDKHETVYVGASLVRLFEKYWDVWEDEDDGASNPFLDEPVGPALSGSDGLLGLEASLEAMTLDRRKGGRRLIKQENE
ncbi:hypothetical protein F5X99DRAFT_407392 [Biscogniauxia marginata]|nr:hypothetical protein F5X99DRAFT_407392 [Biscogniauxia marginata]